MAEVEHAEAFMLHELTTLKAFALLRRSLSLVAHSHVDVCHRPVLRNGAQRLVPRVTELATEPDAFSGPQILRHLQTVICLTVVTSRQYVILVFPLAH